MKQIYYLSIICTLFLISCEKDALEESTTLDSQNKIFSKDVLGPDSGLKAVKKLPQDFFKDINFNLEKAVTPSECGPTEFDAVINASISSNIDALGADWYGDYANFNFYYTITDESEQFFGNQGQYTNYVVNRTRNLEKFWNMPDEVTVRGQHNETLNDKQKIISILEFWYGFPPDLAAFYADYFVDYINPTSTFLTETPLLSFDGFAIALDGFLGQGDLIVIGDGIVELLAATGVEDKIVWSGILAHEWAHQIQFNKGYLDEYDVEFNNNPERTRAGELEADFFAAYYMTHKLGATYNWKRVEAFLEVFFNIGDCAFTNGGHHGTPIQRMEAARLGYELANSGQKKGMILSISEVHNAYKTALPSIVD